MSLFSENSNPNQRLSYILRQGLNAWCFDVHFCGNAIHFHLHLPVVEVLHLQPPLSYQCSPEPPIRRGSRQNTRRCLPRSGCSEGRLADTPQSRARISSCPHHRPGSDCSFPPVMEQNDIFFAHKVATVNYNASD